MIGSDHPLARAHAHPTHRLVRPIALGLLTGALLAAPAGASADGARGPFALVTLPSLGTVTWSCATTREMWGLAARITPRSATTTVRFRAGVAHRAITLNPGKRARFPILRARHQRIQFEQGTEAGVLRAWVRVEFEPTGSTVSHCYPYAPPRIDVHVEPR